MHKRTHLSSSTKARPEPRQNGPSQAEPAPVGARCRTKRCVNCGVLKEINSFPLIRGPVNRRRPYCKRCYTERSAGGWRRRVAESDTSLQHKRCGRCEEIKPQTAFPADSRCADGRRRGLCLRCQAEVEAFREAAKVDLNAPDECLRQRSEAYEQRVDLGIAIAHATCPPGHCRTLEEIAAYADVSREAIRLIEEQALCKVRRRYAELIKELGLTEEEVAL
jgi:hypothetical protein